jgi:hypothetical protein
VAVESQRREYHVFDDERSVTSLNKELIEKIKEVRFLDEAMDMDSTARYKASDKTIGCSGAG